MTKTGQKISELAKRLTQRVTTAASLSGKCDRRKNKRWCVQWEVAACPGVIYGLENRSNYYIIEVGGTFALKLLTNNYSQGISDGLTN